MDVLDAVDRLNMLSVPSAEDTRRLSEAELRELLRNPPKRERSIPVDDAIAEIVRSFKVADAETRTLIFKRLTLHARTRFRGYASTMAVLAVRQNSPELIERGLIALAIEDGGRDWRDSLISMFTLFHSATKLGLDTEKIFAEVSLLARPGTIQKEMRGFPQRPPGSRDLKAFCMEEEGSGENFRYRQIPWVSRTAPRPVRPAETPQQISARLAPDQQQSLIRFAGSLAAMAIQKRSPELVQQGLQGVALGGGALPPSASMEALVKLHAAAVELGMNVPKAFAEAAEFAPEGALKQAMLCFPETK